MWSRTRPISVGKVREVIARTIGRQRPQSTRSRPPFPIPDELQQLVESGWWPQVSVREMTEIPAEVVRQLFPDENSIVFYPPPFAIPFKEEQETDYFQGAKDPRFLPGDIDFSRVLYIGDFGPGSESPIALDYRDNPGAPTVMYLHWLPKAWNEKTGEWLFPETRWLKIADSFREFAEILHLPVK